MLVVVAAAFILASMSMVPIRSLCSRRHGGECTVLVKLRGCVSELQVSDSCEVAKQFADLATYSFSVVSRTHAELGNSDGIPTPTAGPYIGCSW